MMLSFSIVPPRSLPVQRGAERTRIAGSARGDEFKTVAQGPIKEKQAMALDGISVLSV